MATNQSAVSRFSKYFLFFTNFFISLISLLIMVLGAYVIDQKEKEITSFIDVVLDPSMLLVIGGSLGTLLAFLGWIGSLREYVILLKIYCVLVNLFILVQLVVIIFIFIFAYSPDVLKSVNVYPGDALKDSVLRYRDDPDMQDTIDDIQSQLKCCGYSDSDEGYKDWGENMYFNCSQSNPSFERCSVPWSCCVLQQGEKINLLCGAGALDENNWKGLFAPKINKGGCLWSLRKKIQDNFLAVAGVLIGLIVLQLFMVYRAKDLIEGIKAQKKKWKRKQYLPEESTSF